MAVSVTQITAPNKQIEAGEEVVSAGQRKGWGPMAKAAPWITS
jgi:hypothetical protein